MAYPGYLWETTYSPLGGTGAAVWGRVVPHNVHGSPGPSACPNISLGECFCARHTPYLHWFSWKRNPVQKGDAANPVPPTRLDNDEERGCIGCLSHSVGMTVVIQMYPCSL